MGLKLVFQFRLVLIVLFFSFSACQPKDQSNGASNANTDSSVNVAAQRPVFNADSAYLRVKAQVDFGPRVPGTAGHSPCYNYISQMLAASADTMYYQNTTAITFDKKVIPVKNIIASFNLKAERRILLCAHWDTRPFADQDQVDKDKPILGANDGASGVGVLLEIARLLRAQPLSIGVDIVCFDAEDWGDNSGKIENSYCLGSQYWARNLHQPNYKAEFGILLDMVGAPNAIFGFEGFSLSSAQNIVSKVWGAADAAGYQQYFRHFERGYVTDDHYYVMKFAQFPVIDIIDSDPNTISHFGKYWHTHQDNMNAIDRNTLKAVGQTVINVLYGL